MTEPVAVENVEPTPSDAEVREAYQKAEGISEPPEEKPRDEQGRFVQVGAPIPKPPMEQPPAPPPAPEPEPEPATPDFAAEFDRFMQESARQQWEMQQQQMARSARVQPPQPQPMTQQTTGGLTLDDIVKDPDVVRRMAEGIAQQQTIPLAQAFQQLRSQMHFENHRKAAQHVQQVYADYVKREPAYKDPGVKQMADTAMAFAVNQAYQTGNFDSLYNPLLPRMVMFMAKEAMGSQTKPSVRIRGVDASSRTTTQMGERNLSPEQDALRRRLGLTVDQWFANEKAAGG